MMIAGEISPKQCVFGLFKGYGEDLMQVSVHESHHSFTSDIYVGNAICCSVDLKCVLPMISMS